MSCDLTAAILLPSMPFRSAFTRLLLPRRKAAVCGRRTLRARPSPRRAARSAWPRVGFGRIVAKTKVAFAALPEETWMSDEDMKAELERLREENSRLKQRGSRGVSMKVSEKGGVSIYGLGRFPVTLYKEQWEKLLDMAEDIRSFIKENHSKLKIKGDE
jgi:hypothetical protein